jgi:hypothetical protein
VPGTAGSAADCGRLFILFGEPDEMERDRGWHRVAVGDQVLDMEIGQPSVMVRQAEVWVYRDRPERPLSLVRVAIAFDEECRSRGDFAQQLDHFAAARVVHPNIDYKVGEDGHLVKPADQLAGDAPGRGDLKRPQTVSRSFVPTGSDRRLRRRPLRGNRARPRDRRVDADPVG